MSRLVELDGAHHLLLRLPAPTLSLSSLTPAERAVVDAALSGLGNVAIARARGTSPRTVANQLSSAYAKLGIRSRWELARKLAAQSAGVDGAVRELLRGAWKLVERVDAGGRRWAIAQPSDVRLEPGERQALELRAQGASLACIARALGVSEPTASRRVRAGMRKLGIATLAELASVFAEGA